MALEPEGSSPLSKKALKEGIRDVLGGGADISAASPLFVIPGAAAFAVTADVTDRAARLLGRAELNQGGVAVSDSNPISVLSQLPEQKARLFREGVVADTDFLDDEINTTMTYPVIWRIYCCFTTGGILTLFRRMGGFTRLEALNANVALTAGGAYMFDVIVQAAEEIQFQYGVNGVADVFKVVELKGMT